MVECVVWVGNKHYNNIPTTRYDIATTLFLLCYETRKNFVKWGPFLLERKYILSAGWNEGDIMSRIK